MNLLNLHTSILVCSKPLNIVDVAIGGRENIGNSLETDDSLTTAISKFEMQIAIFGHRVTLFMPCCSR